MKNKELNNLEIELDKWFKSTNHKYKNFWGKNKIANLIKKHLKKWGNWRNRPHNWQDW